MLLKKYLLSLLFLSMLTACGERIQEQPVLSQSSSSVPALLDRPAPLWYGTEWQDIQNRYTASRDQWLAHSTDAAAAIQLAEVFINEARITGEHGHYYPAALQMLEGVLTPKGINKDHLFRALSTKAGVQLSLHQFPAAKETAEKALAINPYNAQIYGVLVDANVEMGDYEQAIKMADRMMDIRPDLRSYSRVSYLREIHGDVSGAIEAMEMAVQSGHPALEETAWAMLTLGGLYQKYGHPNKAWAVYETLLEHRPNHPFAIGAKAKILLEKKQYDQAVPLLKEAMAIIPEVGFYMDLAHLYRLTGRQLDAAQLTEEVIVMLGEDTDSGHNMNLELAEVYAHLKGDYEKALVYAKKEYEQRPDNIDVNQMLAVLYHEMGDWNKAQPFVATAIRTGAQYPELLTLTQGISMN